MKIFILDKLKITKFNLPEKIEDSFLIPYKGENNKNDIAYYEKDIQYHGAPRGRLFYIDFLVL